MYKVSKPAILEIKKNEKLFALIFTRELSCSGVKFLTPNEYPLQIALIEHKKGKEIRKHIHNPDIVYEVNTTQEFLFVEKGKVKATIYDEDWTVIDEIILSAGDFFLHIHGGHGFEVIEECRIIEVKQGPYPGDKKAKIFDRRDDELFRTS